MTPNKAEDWQANTHYKLGDLVTIRRDGDEFRLRCDKPGKSGSQMPARPPTRARLPISSRTAGRFQTPHPLFRSRHYQRSSRSS